MTHADAQLPVSRAPGLITAPGRLVNKLLNLGMPMGPNVLTTIRGRKTGELHSQPLAVFEDQGRKWLIGTFGDTNWCRNLRANPDFEIHHGKRTERYVARELPLEEAETFFSAVMPQGIGRMPLYLKLFGRAFVRAAAPDMVRDPVGAARKHPVFEITADPSAPGQTA